MTGTVDVAATFKGFECQVQHASNDQIEDRPGKVAIKVVQPPQGAPQVLLLISHADGTTNCAVLDSSEFLKLAALMGQASREASLLCEAKLWGGVQ